MKNVQEWVSRHRINTSVVWGIVLLGFAKPAPFPVAMGLPLLILGEAIRIWSSGTIQKDTTLARYGPYSITRNPLYLGNFLIGLSLCVIMGMSWMILILFVSGFYFIYQPTIEAEEKKLMQTFGKDFMIYCAQVPRFFPSVLRLPLAGRAPSAGRTSSAGVRFSWVLVVQHREHWTCLAILGVIFFFMLMGGSV